MNITTTDTLITTISALNRADSLMPTIRMPEIMALIIAIISGILIVGIKESARFNALIVVIKVSVVVMFIGIGYFFINYANYHPFIPENTTGEFGHFGWSGILRGAGRIFFAYIGFDAVSTAAQETRNPKRDIDRK